eukprot:1380284-Prymnesium_polylepis.1
MAPSVAATGGAPSASSKRTLDTRGRSECARCATRRAPHGNDSASACGSAASVPSGSSAVAESRAKRKPW